MFKEAYEQISTNPTFSLRNIVSILLVAVLLWVGYLCGGRVRFFSADELTRGKVYGSMSGSESGESSGSSSWFSWLFSSDNDESSNPSVPQASADSELILQREELTAPSLFGDESPSEGRASARRRSPRGDSFDTVDALADIQKRLDAMGGDKR